MSALVLYGTYPIHLVNIYIYDLLMAQAAERREAYEAQVEQVNNILVIYAEENPELNERIKQLKLEIRLITRGTPTTEPLDASGAEDPLRSDPNFNQQQYNAFSVLLKSAYRKVAMLAHPDRGGTIELFNEAQHAYKMRNLPHLNYLWVRLAFESNLYWKQSEDGIEHAQTEHARPLAMHTALQRQPTFAVARFHIIGAPWRASSEMKTYLVNEIKTLSAELTYLRETYANQQTRSKVHKDRNQISTNESQGCAYSSEEGGGEGNSDQRVDAP